MAKILKAKGYESEPPIPKPEKPVQPNVVTVQDGINVHFGDAISVRVVHPINPKAPSKNMSLSMYYMPPHGVMKPGSHYTEECYIILRGQGTMTLASKKVKVRAGMFIHLPPWCEHGVENTGDEMLEIMTCTAPPNPGRPIAKT